MIAPLFARLDAGDRALYARWAAAPSARGGARLGWRVCTRLGGAASTVTAAVAPLAWPGLLRDVGFRALVALTVSHLVVQVLKRCCTRPRPSAAGASPLIREPDRYSFPSGHATAALVVALTYAIAFPAIALPVVAVGLLVGWSRVALGVHFPGDVLAGQAIAAVTAGLAAVLG